MSISTIISVKPPNLTVNFRPLYIKNRLIVPRKNFCSITKMTMAKKFFQTSRADDTFIWAGGWSQLRSQSPNSELSDSYFPCSVFISEPWHNARTNVQCNFVTQHKAINAAPPHFILPPLFFLSTLSSFSPMILRLVYLLTVFLVLSSVVKSDGVQLDSCVWNGNIAGLVALHVWGLLGLHCV